MKWCKSKLVVAVVVGRGIYFYTFFLKMPCTVNCFIFKERDLKHTLRFPQFHLINILLQFVKTSRSLRKPQLLEAAILTVPFRGNLNGNSVLDGVNSHGPGRYSSAFLTIFLLL